MDLELATNEELLAELLRRFDHAVFAGHLVRTTDGKGCGNQEVLRRWRGNAMTCVGLGVSVANAADADLHERCRTRPQE